jgi:tetratricopeptide (TPR) repeat protein
MPSKQDATLRHALLGLRQLVAVNDAYLEGGESMLGALKEFDQNWGNIATAQARLAKIPTDVQDMDLSDESLHTLLDFCNVYPDAGAYLINLRLPPQERITWLESALKASQILKNDSTTQAHLGNIGLAHMEQGEIPTAIQFFEQALQIAEKIEDGLHQGIWAGNLGNAYASLSQHEKAIAYHEKHLAIATKQNDLRNQGHAHANLGVSHAALSQTQKAVEHYENHIEISRQLNDKRELCHALVNMGLMYYDLTELDRAQALFEEAGSIAKDLQDHVLFALAQNGQADVQIDRRNYPQAKELLHSAITSLEKHQDIHVEMRVLASLGNVCMAEDALHEAEVYFDRLYEAATSSGDLLNQALVLGNKVSLYREQGKFAEALDHAERGLALARSISLKSTEGFILWQLGKLFEVQGEITKAIENFQSSLSCYKEIDHPDYKKNLEYLMKFM